MEEHADASSQEKLLLPLKPQIYSPSPSPRPGRTISAPISPSSASLFQDGSENSIVGSTANLANRDVLSIGSIHFHPPGAPHAGHGPSALPQLLQQPLSIISYILSTFAILAPHTTVTPYSPEHEAPRTLTPASPGHPVSTQTADRSDLPVLGSETESAQRTGEDPSHTVQEDVETEYGSLEIVGCI